MTCPLRFPARTRLQLQQSGPGGRAAAAQREQGASGREPEPAGSAESHFQRWVAGSHKPRSLPASSLPWPHRSPTGEVKRGCRNNRATQTRLPQMPVAIPRLERAASPQVPPSLGPSDSWAPGTRSSRKPTCVQTHLQVPGGVITELGTVSRLLCLPVARS